MALLTTIMIGTSALVAGTTAGAIMLLPSSKTVERRTIVNAEPARIYQLLKSNRGFQTFNPYRDSDPSLHIDLFGPAEGVGSAFSFKGKEGRGTQTITALEHNKSVTMQIDLGAMGKPVQHFELREVDGGTEVRWATTSDFGINPVGRIFGVFLDRMLGKTYERGLDNLAQAVAA